MESKESMALVQEMILKAKKSFSKFSFYFLMWGWLLAVSGIMEFIMMKLNYSHAWLPWMIFPIIGAIWSGAHGAKQGRKQQHVTFTDRVMMGIWSSFFVTLVVLIFCCVYSGNNPGPYITIITALPTMITGFLLNFNPLKFGGIFFWIMGIVTFLVPSIYIPLIFALALLGGYITPGILLRTAEQHASV